MKVVISSDTYTPMINGVAVFCESLARGLVRDGHEVLVVCPSLTGKTSVQKDEAEPGLRILRLRSGRFPFYPDQINAVPVNDKKIKIPRLVYKNGLHVSPIAYDVIKKHLDEFKPDVIHNHVPGPVGWSMLRYAKSRKIPFISTGHSYPDNFTANLNLQIVKKPADFLAREYLASIMRLSDYSVFPAAIALKELFPRPKATLHTAVVPNGIDLSRFSPAKVHPSFCKKHKLPVDKPIVSFIGRIDKEKSIDVLIEAFTIVAKETDAHLLFVGDGNFKTTAEKMVKDLKLGSRVTFAGRVVGPDLVEFYRVGTLYATASTTEVQSIAILEAMACGQPIVAVDAGPMSELCHDDENSLLANPEDVEEIANHITNIIKDKKLHAKLSKGALKMANAHDIRTTVSEYLDIYNDAIEVAKE